MPACRAIATSRASSTHRVARFHAERTGADAAERQRRLRTESPATEPRARHEQLFRTPAIDDPARPAFEQRRVRHHAVAIDIERGRRRAEDALHPLAANSNASIGMIAVVMRWFRVPSVALPRRRHRAPRGSAMPADGRVGRRPALELRERRLEIDRELVDLGVCASSASVNAMNLRRTGIRPPAVLVGEHRPDARTRPRRGPAARPRDLRQLPGSNREPGGRPVAREQREARRELLEGQRFAPHAATPRRSMRA